MEEIWKDVVGYEGYYKISNLGNVKNLKTGKINIPKSKGYQTVTLYKDGVKKITTIHRLVAKAFIPNPNNYDIVNHKDETKNNNRADNLEWCDEKYNANYGTLQERKRATKENIIAREEKIAESILARSILSRRESIGMTQRELARIMDTTVTAISKWENNHVEPSLSNFIKLCEVLGMKLDDFIGKEVE